MKKRQTEQTRQTRERSLWYVILSVALPLFALALTVCLILFCAWSIRVRPFVTIELGEESPDASAFLNRAGTAQYVTAPETRYKTAGNRLLRIDVDGKTRPVWLCVRDTVAPSAEGTETTVSVHESPSPDKLITHLKDKSIVRLTFLTAPDYGTVGDWNARIGLQDASGNKSEVPVTVHVRRVRESVTVEAGDPAPTADDFLMNGVEGALETEITAQMLTVPGTYPIRLKADGVASESALIVNDTVAPEAEGKTLIVKPGETVRAQDLLKHVSDKTAVDCAFLTAPDPSLRTMQNVDVRIRDLGGNETTVSSSLLFSDVAPRSVEADDQPLAPEAVLEAGAYETAAFLEPFVPDTVGVHAVTISIDGEENVAIIEVRDTKAPKLTVKTERWYLNEPRSPEQFVEAADATGTSLTFETEPDWTKPEQTVTVSAVDGGGNRASIRFALTLIPDTEPPVFYGVRNRNCYVGEPVAYLREVSAVDDCDGEVEVSVDSSQVNAARKGSYYVTYTATDRAGNTVTQRVTFRFVKTKVTEERAQEVADRITGRIFTEGMTLDEQIRAIHDYVFTHVHYTNRSNKQDWRAEAVRGLTTGRGDCFTSYASARLLLEQTDAEILSVERYGGATRHYWLLVNVGGGWYHFDACNAGKAKNRCFMWTTAQTTAISKGFWRFDESLYPPVATEPYEPGA